MGQPDLRETMATDLRGDENPTPALLVDPSRRLYLTVWTMASLSGLLAGWATTTVEAVWLNLPVPVWAFLVVWAGTSAVLSYRRFPATVAARGLVVGAGFLLVVPVARFGPPLLDSVRAGAVDLGTASDALFGLLTWEMLAVLGALAAVGVSRRLAERATAVRRRQTTQALRRRR
jgi:hypothetical protein